MSGIINYNTTDPSVKRKCWEIMVKPGITKLKNDAVSFWCFLTILISHASMMDWTDILTFTVNRATVNLLKQFVTVPLDTIVTACTKQITQATSAPPETIHAPTASQIALFKAKEMFTYILNTCDEEL